MIRDPPLRRAVRLTEAAAPLEIKAQQPPPQAQHRPHPSPRFPPSALALLRSQLPYTAVVEPGSTVHTHTPTRTHAHNPAACPAAAPSGRRPSSPSTTASPSALVTAGEPSCLAVAREYTPAGRPTAQHPGNSSNLSTSNECTVLYLQRPSVPPLQALQRGPLYRCIESTMDTPIVIWGMNHAHPSIVCSSGETHSTHTRPVALPTD